MERITIWGKSDGWLRDFENIAFIYNDINLACWHLIRR